MAPLISMMKTDYLFFDRANFSFNLKTTTLNFVLKI